MPATKCGELASSAEPRRGSGFTPMASDQSVCEAGSPQVQLRTRSSPATAGELLGADLPAQPNPAGPQWQGHNGNPGPEQGESEEALR